MKISQGNPDLWQTLTFHRSHKLLASNHPWLGDNDQSVLMSYGVIAITIPIIRKKEILEELAKQGLRDKSSIKLKQEEFL